MLSGTEIAKHGIMKNDKDEIWNIYISTSQKIANKGSIGHSLTFYQKQDQSCVYLPSHSQAVLNVQYLLEILRIHAVVN
jgi:hypothetical protein